MTRVVAYVRVSTDKQAEHGVSLDAQRERLRSYAKLYDLEIVEEIVDAGESAKTLARPGLQRALQSLREGRADGLLVAKLDRLTRSVKDLGELVEDLFADGRFALLSVGEQVDTRTAAGRLVLNVLGSVAQWERETIAERTRAAMRHMRERGEYVGGKPPYGYRVVDGELVADPVEQGAAALARRLKAAGLSLRAIAAELEAAGHRPRSAARFAPAHVQRILAAA